MLPAAAVVYFPWEINTGSLREGESSLKRPLSTQYASAQHKVVVHTLFVEPFDAIIGAQYMVLGEIENSEGGGVVVRARVLNCVDGVNLVLFQKAVNQQRSFFQERESKVTPPN
ncbi:CST complex subunit TEN1 [Merluccius polli]|uniref:CST complex subunit TEN1 n=1 Tax=Merluccius polli TaxID=89951 RepID=A0AA47MSC5_MERPO|nr:CST complex subunit TEN1 [Merluccius polli]